jgi:uncharacterized protein (TIGR03546 family)
MNIRRWLHEHSLRLLAIRDTPEAIAGGVAIGMFFGFTPLFGLKTLSAIFFAWLTRSNILAAVIAGTLHDVIIPFMPAIFVFEYKVGSWLLSQPHTWPRHVSKMLLNWHEWHSWTMFLTIGKPLLLGSVIVSAPLAIISYFLTLGIVARHQRRKALAAGAGTTDVKPEPDREA